MATSDDRITRPASDPNPSQDDSPDTSRPSVSSKERAQSMINTLFTKGVPMGLARVRFSDELLSGEAITVDGHRMLNFGNCSYLGLSTDERLKSAAVDAVERLGVNFSSSPQYAASELYPALSDRLSRMLDAPVVVPPTTTLGHLGVLPSLISELDAVIVDQAAHSSVQMASRLLAGEGTHVIRVPHNNVAELSQAVSALSGAYRRVWYLADGLYSMHGDIAPVDEIAELMETHKNFWVYYDDAHGFSWSGEGGRGIVLDRVGWHPRMVIAAGLAKSFGTNGAVVAFPDAALRDWVANTATTLMFSGPIPSASLGASIAAADIHLSSEQPQLAAALVERIRHTQSNLDAEGLVTPSREETPIFFVEVGPSAAALEIAQRMLAAGFWVNTATFPAVPRHAAGLRFTITNFLSFDDISAMTAELGRLHREIV